MNKKVMVVASLKDISNGIIMIPLAIDELNGPQPEK